MKKIIALVLALVMMSAMAIPAIAADITYHATNNTSPSGGTDITYSVSKTYTLTIPEDFTLSSSTTTADVSVSNSVIAHGEEVVVKVDSINYSNGWNLVLSGDANTKISYTIKDGNTNVTPATEIIAAAAGTTTATVKLSFDVTGTAVKSGTYTDTITFTASVGNA